MELTIPSTDDLTKASFDLTDFGSAQVWTDLCDRHDLDHHPAFSGDGFEWLSANGDLVVHTYNHPVTGEHHTDRRHDEPGYASYIHVLGSPESVESFYDDVRDVAQMIDGGSCLGEFIV